MVVVSRDCAGAPGGGRRRRGGGALPMAMRLPHIVANSVPFPGHREWDAVFWQDVAQMYSQRGLGRQKGVSRARYSRDVFPGTVFHCFSRLKSYITSLSCQKQAVRACISAISCHEEVFLPSRAPLRMHDGHSLPLLDAQPFHAGHPEGYLAGDPRWMRRQFRLTAHQAESRAIPIGEPRYSVGDILRSASATTFLLRSPFRSRLRRAFHRARNR